MAKHGNKESRSRSNKDPSKIDPSRTKTLRNKFAAELRGRVARVNAAVREVLIQDDALGLINRRITANEDWSLLPKGQQLAAFRRWLDKKLDDEILKEGPEGFIESAYKKGSRRAAKDMKKAPDIKTPTELGGITLPSGEDQAAILSSAFNEGVGVEKLAIIKTQTKNNISGLSATLRERISDRVAVGMVRGDSPYDMADEITRITKKVGKNRATTIARTEVIRAHAEGALDMMESMGAEEIGVAVEWSTAGDTRVCPLCEPLEEVIIPIKKAHGMFPRHPNCRCTPIPAFEAFNKKRFKSALQRSLKKSRSGKAKTKGFDWPGRAAGTLVS